MCSFWPLGFLLLQDGNGIFKRDPKQRSMADPINRNGVNKPTSVFQLIYGLVCEELMFESDEDRAMSATMFFFFFLQSLPVTWSRLAHVAQVSYITNQPLPAFHW